MKKLEVQDVVDLQKKFNAYTEHAEQHEFPLLFKIDIMLQSTVEAVKEMGEVRNQNDANAMFRVVLRAIGEDYSEYAV